MRRLTLIVAGAVAVVTGCHNSHHDHDHPDEPRTAQITIWTEHCEVFAEHAVPVAGQATSFYTHVTDLRDFTPLTTDAITFVMRQGDSIAEKTEARLAKPGIYMANLRFPSAGDWRLTLLLPSGGTNLSVELGKIKVYSDTHAALHAELPAMPDGVTFLKEQQWSLHLQTALADRRSLVERVRVLARVRPKPGHSASVVAPVSGQLRLPPGREPAQPGQQVEAGEVLVWLTPNFSEAAARLAEAEAAFGTAKAALDQTGAAHRRTKELAAAGARSPRELEEAELAWQTARANYTAAAGLLETFKPTGEAQAAMGSLAVELRAPIGGVLTAVAAGPGEVVTAEQPVFTVLNPETVWLEARVPEASLSRLNTAGDAVAVWPGEPERHTLVTGAGHGRLVSLGLEVDTATRTVPLIYETANHDHQFRIGQSVPLQVATARVENALAIPENALVEEGGQPIAFVQVAGETFLKRHLKLGLRDRGWVQVLTGLDAGERVVTQGAFAVRLASLSGAIPEHGHTH